MKWQQQRSGGLLGRGHVQHRLVRAQLRRLVLGRGDECTDCIEAVRTKGVEVVMLEVAASELEIEAHVGC